MHSDNNAFIKLEEEETVTGSRDQEEALEYLLNKRFQADNFDLTVREWIKKRTDLSLLGMKIKEDGLFIEIGRAHV